MCQQILRAGGFRLLWGHVSVSCGARVVCCGASLLTAPLFRGCESQHGRRESGDLRSARWAGQRHRPQPGALRRDRRIDKVLLLVKRSLEQPMDCSHSCGRFDTNHKTVFRKASICRDYSGIFLRNSVPARGSGEPAHYDIKETVFRISLVFRGRKSQRSSWSRIDVAPAGQVCAGLRMVVCGFSPELQASGLNRQPGYLASRIQQRRFRSLRNRHNVGQFARRAARSDWRLTTMQ